MSCRAAGQATHDVTGPLCLRLGKREVTTVASSEGQGRMGHDARFLAILIRKARQSAQRVRQALRRATRDLSPVRLTGTPGFSLCENSMCRTTARAAASIA